MDLFYKLLITEHVLPTDPALSMAPFDEISAKRKVTDQAQNIGRNLTSLISSCGLSVGRRKSRRDTGHRQRNRSDPSTRDRRYTIRSS